MGSWVRSWGRDWEPRYRAGLAIALIVIVVVTAFSYGRKIEKGKSAFVRWQPQIQALLSGEDVYLDFEDGEEPYPNPPLMGLLLFPLAALPTAVGAWLWFGLKVVMAAFAVGWAIEAVAPRGPPLTAPWVIAGIALSLRPIVSDLMHGNVNILILFLVMAGLRALQNGRDVAAGLWVALAMSLKITPGLLFVYFAYKRWWRASAACAIGVVGLSLVPGFVLGFGHTMELLASYYGAMLEPFSAGGTVSSTTQFNQSMGAVLLRYVTDVESLDLRTGPAHFNLLSLDVETAQRILRVLTLALLGWLAFVCRSPGDRRGLRIATEYGLVVIAMLMISPRTWKHHYVVMALPYLCVLAWASRSEWRAWRSWLFGTLITSQVLVFSTSRDFAKIVWFLDEAHKYALAGGAYLMSGVIVLLALSALLLGTRHSGVDEPTVRAVSATGG